MKTRLIRAGETAAVVELVAKTVRASWPAFYPQESIDWVLANDFTAEGLEKKLKNAHFYVVENDGKIVACGGIKKCGIDCKLFSIFVTPNLQGKGIGKSILKTLEADEYAKSSARIELPSSIAGLSFYIKNGYRHKGGSLNYSEGQFMLEKLLKS